MPAICRQVPPMPDGHRNCIQAETPAPRQMSGAGLSTRSSHAESTPLVSQAGTATCLWSATPATRMRRSGSLARRCSKPEPTGQRQARTPSAPPPLGQARSRPSRRKRRQCAWPSAGKSNWQRLYSRTRKSLCRARTLTSEKAIRPESRRIGEWHQRIEYGIR